MHDQPFTESTDETHAIGTGARRNGSKRADAQESGVGAGSKLQDLLADAATILAEPNEQFEALLNEYRAEFLPLGPHQDMLIRELAVSDWRLRQITRIETGLQWLEMSEMHSSMCRPDIQVRWDYTPSPRPPASISEASNDLRTLLMGAAWLENAKLFALLVRYQNNARRDYYRALKQLEQVRTGKAAYLPSQPDKTNQTNPTAPPKAAAAGAGSSSKNQTNPTQSRTTPPEPACSAVISETNPTQSRTAAPPEAEGRAVSAQTNPTPTSKRAG